MTGPRILVVRISSMGDVIHALPAAATLKHGFPGSRLAWVVHPRWAPLLEGNPFIDEIVLLDRRSMRSVREAWSRLRAARFDFAVDFQGLIQSAIVASAARPDRIFGFHTSQVREKPAALFYSNKVRVSTVHVVDRNLELAAATGASSMLQSFPLPDGTPEGFLPDGDFVLASPIAGWGAKQWPLASYRELARRLHDELGLTLVLNGPPDSAALLASAPEAMPHFSGIPGLICATRRAIAVVGTDSGPLHLAAALGKPGVAIFGPTDPARNGPYSQRIVVLRSPDARTSYKRNAEASVMHQITPDAVFEALKARLPKKSTGHPA